MFLSKDSITKQLFYEFLQFKTLALAPGKPVQLLPGTLLASSTTQALDGSIKTAATQLKKALCEHRTEQEQAQFDALLSSLVTYKNATYKADNPFSEYAAVDASVAHPSAWLALAPLVIDELPGSSLSYNTEQSFKDYLKKPRVAFRFNVNCPLEETGLHIAVTTKNHEMVDAFLTPAFYGYSLTVDDLKKLLLLTDDPKTRLALFRHSNTLIDWISTDNDLQIGCVKSFEELSGLWAFLSAEQRKQFILHTHSQLWLNLLDKDLGKQKIEKLLGPDFNELTNKLLKDNAIKNSNDLPTTLAYLNQQEQFKHLLQSDINNLYPHPRGAEWQKLLSALGYKHTRSGLTITRYILPEEVTYVHNQLVSVLISLPVDAKVIVEALQKIEAYAHQPTADLYKQYQDHLNAIAHDVIQKEYEAGFFIVNWFNQLLRFLGIIKQSPLHPYIDRLSGVVNKVPISGELMNILPPTDDYEVYKPALSAYFKNDIGLFWAKLSPKDKEKIIHDPIRFEALVRFLPDAKRPELFQALDLESLKYFNTPEGLHQLILETPSFNVKRDFSHLVKAMKEANIVFLDDAAHIIKLLVDDNAVLQQVTPYLPFKFNSADSPDVQQVAHDFQQLILETLPTPFEKEHVKRFIEAYCPDANQFSSLLSKISTTSQKDPLNLVSTCWESVPDYMWAQWYSGSQHAVLWAPTLNSLSFAERLDFFEKLTSGGALTAEEFCDFVLKDHAVFNTLWDKVPKPQWDTWIKDNNLPLSIVSLLNTIEYPVKILFLKDVLTRGLSLQNICVTPGKTVEQFYLEDVIKKVKGATGASDVQAKLVSLKDTKRKEYNTSLEDLTRAIESVHEPLENLKKEDIKKYKGMTSRGLGLFITYSYYTHLSSIKASRSTIENFYKNMSLHPLSAVVKDGPEFTNLGKAMDKIREDLETFTKKSAEVPLDLKTELEGLELIFKKIDALRGVPPLVSKDMSAEPQVPRSQPSA